MFQKILVAVDESSISKQALEEAITLAKLANSNLLLVHVQSPFEATYPTRVFPYESTYPGTQAAAFKLQLEEWSAIEQQGVQFLQALTDQATAEGVDADFTQPLGNPGHVICDLAQTWGADLIMMGRRGRTGINELIGGSVSNYVVHHAPCSVLAVQGKVTS